MSDEVELKPNEVTLSGKETQPGLDPAVIGDKGQRFEVRFRENGVMIMPPRVLGWSKTRSGARKMVRAWKKKPGVTHVWIYDRQEKQQRGHWT